MGNTPHSQQCDSDDCPCYLAGRASTLHDLAAVNADLREAALRLVATLDGVEYDPDA